MARFALRVLIFALAAPALALAQTPAPDPCVPTPTTLCLSDDRFRVEVDWYTESDGADTVGNLTTGGRARATPISDAWTGMWFSDPDNLDLLVHVFPGCNANARYWVYAAGLTNVEVDLIVTDTRNGAIQIYRNPLGQPFAPITDTDAFSTCPRLKRTSNGNATPPALAGNSHTGCVASSTTTCLLDGRFQVSMQAFGAPTQVQLLADGTAGFLFGNPTFFDAFVSIRDGRSANDNFWLTYSAFPGTQDFTLNVLDTATGTSRSYGHDASDPLFMLDKTAFAGDPIQTVDGTFSGSWYAPERDGEGFIFDIFAVEGVPMLGLYYFTYANDSSGRQAWMIGAAPIIGDTASVPVITASGAQFGSAFDPADVQRSDWGHIKITFLDCSRIRAESGSPLFPSVDYEAIRLSPAPSGVQGVCQATASAPSTTSPQGSLSIDGGYSGSWYQPARDGEGFIFNIAEIGGVKTLLAYYFIYENNSSGRQAWVAGAAPISGASVEVPMMITSGAQFGDPFDPGDVVRTPWGTVTITWQSCSLANVQVVSPLYGDISFPIVPLTGTTLGATGDCGL